MARILIIDDEYAMRTVLRQTLERAGYEVADAPNGDAGLTRLREWPADLVLTDLFMPEKEGIETIREVRREFPGVKIIVMSGGSMRPSVDYFEAEDYLDWARKFGAHRALTKPFDRSSLLDAIRDLLEEEPHS
jgi:CheY-like chemotaxis protein